MTVLSAHAITLRNIKADIKKNPGNMDEQVVANVASSLGGIALLFENLGDEIQCVFCKTQIEKAGMCEKCSDEICGEETTEEAKA